MAKLLLVGPRKVLGRGEKHILTRLLKSHGCEDWDYSTEVRGSPICVAVLVDAKDKDKTFVRLTGIKDGGIMQNRGYMFSPAQARPAMVKRKAMTVYKSSGKRKDGSTYKKGDPREITETVVEQPEFPDSVEWIIPTLHPAAVMREGLKSIPALNADLARAVRASIGEAKPLDVEYDIRPTRLGEGAIAVDIETAGKTSIIERVGLSTGEKTWTAPWTAEVRERAQKELADAERTKIAHNWQFDLPRLEASGIQIPGRLFDTMLAAHLLQPDLYKGLARCSTLYLDLRSWKHLSDDRPAFYNASDVRITHALYEEQMLALSETGMDSLFLDTIMPATRVLMNMTKRGIRVDKEYLREWQLELSGKQKGLYERWYGMAPGVNPASPPQLKKLFYKEMGLPEQTTKYGGVTTDEAALKNLLRGASASHGDLLRVLLEIREVSKLKGTYSEIALGADGCVHPGYLPASKDTDKSGAATGRLASSNPNIQNQPPDSRRMFIPRERMVFLEADFSQIELRIAASLSEDGRLLAALRTEDVHAENMQLLGCDRVRAKNVVYGSLYGAGPRKLSAILGQHGVATTERECRDLQRRLAEAYPRLWAWRSQVAQEARDVGYLTNPFGRRRYFYGGSSQTPQAIDYLPQSTAADILWSCLVPLEVEMLAMGGALVATVHDSVLVEVPSEKVGVGKEALVDVMEREWPQISAGFQVPVNIKQGLNWRDIS